MFKAALFECLKPRPQSLLAAAAGLLLWAPVSWSSSISGQLTDSATGLPIAGAQVQALHSRSGLSVAGSSLTDAQGRYVIDDLWADYYVLQIRPAGYVGRLFGSQQSINCSHSESLFQCAQRLPQDLGLVESVQLNLQTSPAARLRGRVIGADQRQLSFARVQVGASSPEVPFNVDRLSGEFLIDHIIPGSYLVEVCAEGWICRDASGAEFDVIGSDAARLPVQFEAGRTFTLADMQLRDEARIELDYPFPLPTFIEPHNLPEVSVRREGDQPYITRFPLFGNTRLSGLRPGRFRVLFGKLDDPRWHARWHDGTDCTRTRCKVDAVTPIVVGPGNSRIAVTALQSRQRITGQIFQPGTQLPIEGIGVAVLRWNTTIPDFALLDFEELAQTDAEGRYELIGLPPDSYVLLTSNGLATAPWLSERWPEVRCTARDTGTCLPVNENQFVLQADQHASGVNFTPELGGTISGQFSDAAGTMNYVMLQETASLFSTHEVGADRRWRSGPLPQGYYTATGVQFTTDFEQVRQQVFNLRDCPEADCRQVPADPIGVSAGRDSPGVDFVFADRGPNARGDGKSAVASALARYKSAASAHPLLNNQAVSRLIRLREEPAEQ